MYLSIKAVSKENIKDPPKKKILIVEDDKIILLKTKRKLERQGYIVISANTGERAVGMVGSGESVDLVLMDIDLGRGIDGIAAAEEILKIKDIPLIFLSSHTDQEFVEKTEQVTSYGYIVKNTSDVVLNASIKMAFRLFESIQRQKAEEATVRMYAENTSDIIWTADLNFNINYISPTIEALTGDSPEKFMKKNVCDIHFPEDMEKLISVFTEELRKESNPRVYKDRSRLVEVRYLRPDGRYVWVEHSIKFTRDASGRVNGMLGTTRDVSERKAKEEEINRLTNAKMRFLSMMSHEIRTPINAILGLTDLALDVDDPEEKSNYLYTLKSSASHLLGMINDVLDYSKIESGLMKLENIPFSPFKELQIIIEMLKYKCVEKGLAVNIEEMALLKSLYVYGDPTRFRQVFINILGNAIKFTENGAINIRIYHSAKNMTAKHNKKIELGISIQDTGIGIPADKLDLIFSGFSQADNSISRKYGGTGLGLSISKELVFMMGGSITVESEYGKGTAFIVQLPFKISEAPSDDDSSAPVFFPAGISSYSDNKYSILVAEDNAVNLKLIKAVLEKNGHSFTAAGTGLEVISILSKQSFDLVLMDIEMPEMDGIEAAKRIRGGEAGQGNLAIPIIALSSNLLGDMRDACLKAGMNCAISKPLNIKELDHNISELFITPKSAAEE